MANRNTRHSKSVLGAMVQALKNGELSPPEAKAELQQIAATTPSDQVLEQVHDALDTIAELPELVPDVANPEGVPPTEVTDADRAAMPEQKAAGPVLQVKQGLTLRGGRGEWYKLLCKYDGKPVADYIAEGKASPASHYTARSTKCGQPKTPESRLSWFKRAGIVTIK